MKATRRDVLKAGLGSFAALSVGTSVPLLVPRMAMAKTAADAKATRENVLVILQLTGGNDGLNTLVPHGNDDYHKLRPKLAIKDKLIKVSDTYSLHPGLDGFRELLDRGALAMVHDCGYPKPNRSHFESMDIWHTANPQDPSGFGWIGHYLDHALHGSGNVVNALAVGNQLPNMMKAKNTPVPSVQNINNFGVQVDGRTKYDAGLERKLINDLNQARENNPSLGFLARQATDAIMASREIREATRDYQPDAEYPRGLGDRLKMLARIINANLGARVLYTEIGGFDTHANQHRSHHDLMKAVGDALLAFHTDLKAKGLSKKVMVMGFSEFGRRAAENDSSGTDHGAAGPMFLVGDGVKPGLHGTPASLTDLDRGDLKHTTDFRSIYAELLDRWLNTESRAVLGNAFSPINVIA